MNESQIIEKLLRGETLTETEIGLFLLDTSNSERIHEEVFKHRGNVSHIRTVKRIRGKLYETLWERTATDCAYPKQPYEIADNPYWQSLTDKAKGNSNAPKVSPKPALYLYLLSQDENSGYDTYDSCIVCAESEDEAKRTHPDEEYYVWNKQAGQWAWRNPIDPDAECRVDNWATRLENIHCKLIGTAADGIEKKGVVIASFNAG